MDISIAGTDDNLFQYKITHGNTWIVRESIAGTDDDLFQYMLTRGNSWITQESIMTSDNFLLSSYLATQKHVREIIKIEEVVSMSNDDLYLSGAAEDVKDVYTFHGEEYHM